MANTDTFEDVEQAINQYVDYDEDSEDEECPMADDIYRKMFGMSVDELLDENED